MVNRAAWVALFKRYDTDQDGVLNFEEFKAMAKECRVKDRKPSDVECELLARQVNGTEFTGAVGDISEATWTRWVTSMSGKKERKLIYLQQARDLKAMPTQIAQQIRDKAYMEEQMH